MFMLVDWCAVSVHVALGVQIHGVTPTIVRKLAKQGGASQLKLVATPRVLVNPSVFEEVFACAF